MHWHLYIDALVLVTYFVAIVGIGLRAGRGNKNLSDYAIGHRSIPWWAVMASIIAAETSAATFLGAPAEGFAKRSFSYAQLAIGVVLARIFIAYLFIVPYFRYRVQSIYEFLDLRFGPRTRDAASAIFLITRVLGIGVRLYLGGVILVVIWRYLLPSQPVTLSTYFWGITFVTVVTTFYTAVGGIKAVVWTDLIQACLMIGAIVFALFAILRAIPGGMVTVMDTMASNPGAGMFQTGWPGEPTEFWPGIKAVLETPYTIWAAVFGSTFLTMATHGTDQDMVQRLLTAENPNKSKLSLILSGIVDIPIVLAFLAVGMLLFVFYEKNPDPTMPSAANEVFAHYIVHEIPVGIRGLIIAGVFATMMGSTSAALNALATSFVRDFYQPYVLKRKTVTPSANASKPALALLDADPAERASVRMARVATVVFGLLMIGIATLAAEAVLRNPNATIIPMALGILGYSYGSVLAMFLLGVLTEKRGNDISNVVAMAIGVAAVLCLCRIKLSLGGLVLDFGSWLPSWWPVIAFPYYVLIGTIVTFAIAVCFPGRGLSTTRSTTHNKIEAT